MSWPDWVEESLWLSRLVGAAEEEARERGHYVVEPHHLALALTRDDDTRELLGRLGLRARIWRDYLNFILGFRSGVRSVQHQRMRPGDARHPEEIYYSGPLQVGASALAVVREAHQEADLSGVQAGAPHLLVALMESGCGGVGVGTARWLGLAPTTVRQCAGLPIRPRPAMVWPEVAELPRPSGVGPLVLLGGGPTPPEALQTAVKLARRPGLSTVRIALITAALRGVGVEEVVQARIDDVDAAVEGVQVDYVGLASREDAHSQEVCATLAKADVVFLEGGSAVWLCQALIGTPALYVLVDASDRGVVLVGYSAGTQAMGAGCLEGWESPRPLPLLGWLNDFVIQPHCSGDGRQAQLRRLVAAFPGRRGLGVAHGGAVLVVAGWSRLENLVPGYDEGSVVLEDAEAPAHRLAEAPFSIGR